MYKTYKKEFIKKTGYKCQFCGISEWRGDPISLELDHIDGDNCNNHENNLRLLCPNCHSQTDTYRGRNIKRKREISDQELLDAIKSTDNIKQALTRVGLVPKGKNYIRAWNLLEINQDVVDSKNSQFGTVWINNGKINKKIKDYKLLEFQKAGWTKGRILLKVSPPSAAGKIWITNGIVNKFNHFSEIPEGWWRGKIESK